MISHEDNFWQQLLSKIILTNDKEKICQKLLTVFFWVWIIIFVLLLGGEEWPEEKICEK